MSNLTVSYVSQTPAVSTTAGTTAAAPAADGPLGFLAALVDQLVTDGAKAAQGEIAAKTGAQINVPGLVGMAIDATATTPQTTNPLSALGTRLDQLAATLQNGEATSATQLQDLTAAIAALSDALDGATSTEATGASTPGSADPVTDLVDRLNALSQTLAATAPALADKLDALAAKIEAKPEIAAGLAGQSPTDGDAATISHIIRTLLGHETKDSSDDTKPTQDGASSDDDLLKVLATLGINVPATASGTVSASDADASPADASASAVPAPLLRLANQLSKVGTELAGAAPELAKKLESVATQMVAATADPGLLDKLTAAAAQPSGTSLDTLVQSLLDPKSTTVAAVPATPQISASTKLALPAQNDAETAPPVSDTDATQPAPRIAISAATTDTTGDKPAEPKAEAKVAAIVADAARSDQTAQPTPTQAQTAPVAPQHARALPAAYQTVANPINMGQVAFEMVRQVQQGSSRFTIRLDPPELGRVDVKMQVDATGAVNARLTVDRAETLDLFQRDRQSLERALSQAGLDTSKTNLEFSLRQQNQNPFAGMMGGDQRQQQSNYGNAQRFASNDGDDIAPTPAITLYRGTASAAGVNIFA